MTIAMSFGGGDGAAAASVQLSPWILANLAAPSLDTSFPGFSKCFGESSFDGEFDSECDLGESAEPAGAEPPGLGKITSIVTPRRDGSSSLRREMYELMDILRPYAVHERCRKCSRVRVKSDVEVGISEGRARLSGLLRCSSVWECPPCSLGIRTKRADELKTVLDAHGQDRAYMMTLTVRHGWTDDLKTTRASVADAFRKMQQGKPWKSFKARLGLVGTIRALEVTHSKENGWHPHLHVLLLTEEAIPKEVMREHQAWLSARWIECVGKVLGADYLPDEAHGCLVSSVKNGEYLSKLGLELTAPAGKSAKKKSRSPFQIARDIAASSKEVPDDPQFWSKDIKLWRSYCEGMRGAKMLTWSKDLKDKFGIDDKEDEELVEKVPAEVIYTIPGQLWDEVHRELTILELIDVAERGGGAAVEELLYSRLEWVRQRQRMKLAA